MTQDLMLSSGWILVTDESGTHWVYGPLWDPAKMDITGRAILATQVLKQAIGATTEPAVKDRLWGMLKEQVNIVTENFANSVLTQDDDWCATKPYKIPVPPRYAGSVPIRPPHGTDSGGGGIPPYVPLHFPINLGEKLLKQVHAKIATALLGEAISSNQLEDISAMI